MALTLETMYQNVICDVTTELFLVGLEILIIKYVSLSNIRKEK